MARYGAGLLIVLSLLVVSVGCGMDVLAARTPTLALSEGDCPPLDPPEGDTVRVSNEADLRDQVTNAPADTTILVQAGIYQMQDYVHIVHDGVALRGEIGDRDDVILDFGGMVGGHFGIQIDADDVTIADLTIRNATDHGVSIQGRDRPVLYNLHILDIGDQLVKVNPLGDGSQDGLLACSRLAYTTSDPDGYTNGISAHLAHRWVVRDNQWIRIRGAGDQPVPTILFWSGSADTVVERNLLVDCSQGIAFGNSGQAGINHTGGVVRNNMIVSSLPHDVAIEMVRAQGWLVAHNTVVLLNPSPGLTWGMEARYGESSGLFAYNLTNMAIWADRDEADGGLLGNVTDAESSWFVDISIGDLHLQAGATAAIDQATTLPEVPDDYDGESRPVGSAPDVGADEYSISPPAAVRDLRVGEVITATGSLTASLHWTPPALAVTTTLSYSSTVITASNWGSATLLTDTLPGAAGLYLASLPTASGTVYFALKTQNGQGAWSALSNLAFWPARKVYLPLTLRGQVPPQAGVICQLAL